MTHSKAPYRTIGVRLRAQIFFKVSVLPENISSSNFCEVEIKEICLKVVYQEFWPILGPYDPLKIPLHYQRSPLQGSYSLKILHKILLL